ncbi:hypothetical protein OsJ_35824 [Oryza sativa Japonica Group]|uniref:Uncharacterized protein n=1 Tax=Oryza sativa subsp. japonica TaxID=39947 RepID=B9GCR4_ORYSJ|nr:hypothetical protein OsJ_35824 [Oryza sativa Japonica Group]
MEGGGEDTAAAMAMEVEIEAEAVLCMGTSSPATSNSSSPSPNSGISSRRLGLKNSIQTNFGDDYVFQIASWTYALCILFHISGNKSGELYARDGTIRAWDTRSFKQISLLRGSQELFSFSFGGSSGNLLAAGSNSQVLLWDWRNSKQLACLEESHMDDVTQVKFAPHQHSKLISAAVDGLICVFDTDGDMNEDNHLLSVMNVETSVAKVGFFGNTYQKIWCLSHIETLSTWDWNDGSRELNIDDARSLATDRWNLDHVDYFVDCHYSLPDDKLWVIGGTTAGTIGYFPVRAGLEGAIGSAEAILEGGHTDVVRTVYPAANTHTGQNRGIFGWTGGEDGRLCCWRSGEIAEMNKSWISSSLVSRVQKKAKCRQQPY